MTVPPAVTRLLQSCSAGWLIHLARALAGKACPRAVSDSLCDGRQPWQSGSPFEIWLEINLESKVYLLVNQLTGAIDSAAHEAVHATVTPDSGTRGVPARYPSTHTSPNNNCMFSRELSLPRAPEHT